jgi:hypothetical protein
VGKGGGVCPDCSEPLYLSDVLRTHDEYSPEGSNQTAITRTMNIAERLMTLSYLDLFYSKAGRPLDRWARPAQAAVSRVPPASVRLVGGAANRPSVDGRCREDGQVRRTRRPHR